MTAADAICVTGNHSIVVSDYYLTTISQNRRKPLQEKGSRRFQMASDIGATRRENRIKPELCDHA